MNTITNYLENMFSTLPKTPEIAKLKNELLSNMEDKYEELKNEGKTENEAIGIVISEFGNIDELLDELEISTEENTSCILGIEESTSYIKDKKYSSFLVSIGVSLIIVGASLLILLYQLIDDGIILSNLSGSTRDVLPLFPLFILLVPSIALFIFSGSKMEKYKFIEKGDFSLSLEAKSFLQGEFNTFNPKFTIKIMLGVSLCILSPVCIFLGSILGDSASTYSVVPLLLIIAIAVALFINTGSVKEGYKQLLKLEEYNIKERQENKVIGAVASIVWPIAVCIFLFISFVYNAWYISWIVFPITGVLFGAFSAVYSIIRDTTHN